MSPRGLPRSPILSLTVLDSATLRDGVVQTDSKVLVVARREDTNPTHPNVVSVPTQRIPEALRDSIAGSAVAVGKDPTSGVSYFSQGYLDSKVHNGHHPTINAIEALLSRKLGLAESLESEQVSFRAALKAQVDGVALYDNIGDSDVYEPVSMLNVVIELDQAQAKLPMRTSSYSVIAWAAVESFLDGVETRDPARVSPELDPLALCVHGVCLQAAQASLVHLVGHPPFQEECRLADTNPLHLMPHGLEVAVDPLSGEQVV